MSLLLLFRPRTGAVVTADPVTPDDFVIALASIGTVYARPVIGTVIAPSVSLTSRARRIPGTVIAPSIPDEVLA